MGKKRKKEAIQNPMELLLNRSQALLEKDEYNALLKELEKPLRGAFRINPLKCSTTAHQFASLLAQRYGWEIEPIPYSDTSWWINSGDHSSGQTWEHRNGQYYVQDASSMLPVELFDFNEQEPPLILDLAASPGGKTTHMISKTGDRGLVIANDASKDRITALRLVLKNWGSIAHAITQFPGEKYGNWYPHTFDKVLLDAPCSMQNLRSTEARPMRSISHREEQSLSKRQRKLLESALHAAKPGGQIVYATCTLMPEENEAVLDWLLHKYPGQVEIFDVSKKVPVTAPALLEDESHKFSPEVIHALRIWPHCMASSGFFCARLNKLDKTDPKIIDPPSFDIHQTGFAPLDAETQRSLISFYEENFGFNLETTLEMEKIVLWTYKQQIIAFPESYFTKFHTLPLRSLGLPVASQEPGGFRPDHHWISRFYNEFRTCAHVLDEIYLPSWLSGEDIQQQIFSDKIDSYLILKNKNGDFLGIGKQQKNRLRNLLPRRMVL
ncbi:MAG: hypothetical protein K8R40_05310 [Anaerolineaceae bacterium]|nr:hypothetical protein [Anaerolineaceae bacterium]